MRVYARVMLLTFVMMLTTGAVAGIAQPRSAADPIVGTWKLNLAKSKFPPGMPGIPKSQTESYRQAANGQLELVFSRVIDGPADEITLVWPAAGGAVTLRSGTRPPGETLIETRLAPGDWLVTYMMKGEQYGTMRKTVSADRKTMRQTFNGVVEGKPLEIVAVLDRQ